MREAGSMNRPFQDLGTKNLFYVLMQLTAGMGDRQLLLQCIESVSLVVISGIPVLLQSFLTILVYLPAHT